MNNLHEVVDKLTSGDAPAWVLGGAGIILLLLALKAGKGFLKFVLVVLALATLAGAVCWYLHRQGKL